MVELSLIIPTQGEKTLFDLLRSIRGQSGLERVEILVICNPHNENIRNEVISFGFRYFSSKKGVNRARNVGAHKARAAWLYFVDDDVRLPGDKFLFRVLNRIKSLQKPQIVGGGYLPVGRKNILDRVYARIQEQWFARGVFRENLETSLYGGNLIVEKSIFNSLSFDERIPFGGSERDFLLRAKQQGITLKQDRSLDVEHQVKMSIQSLVIKGFYQGQGEQWTLLRTGLDSTLEFIEPTVFAKSFLERGLFHLYYISFSIGGSQGLAIWAFPPFW